MKKNPDWCFEKKNKKKTKNKKNKKNKKLDWCFERTFDYYNYHGEETYETVEYCLQEKCNPFINDNQFGNFVGIGTYGVVYEVFPGFGGNDIYVAKAIPLNVIIPTIDCNLMDMNTWSDCLMVNTDEFIEEAEMAKKAGDVRVGPKVITYFICDETLQITRKDKINISMGVIVMKKVGISLEDYIKLYPRLFMKNANIIEGFIKRKADILEGKLGYLFNDMHEGNIMLDYDYGKGNADINDAFFIDFADVSKIDNDYGIGIGTTFRAYKRFIDNYVDRVVNYDDRDDRS